jgi:hypothetical protein
VAAAKATGWPLIIKIKRGGTGHMSGNGPSGHKATPRALLARTLRDRPGVAAKVTERQSARVSSIWHMTEVERLIIVNQIEIINALRVNNNTIGLGHALAASIRALADDDRAKELVARALVAARGAGVQ